MFIQRCQKIRDLTADATKFIANNQIESCLTVLVKRQALLEELEHRHQYSPDDLQNTACFIELIHWLQQEDKTNSAQVMVSRSQSKKKSVNQMKISRALHHYKNLT